MYLRNGSRGLGNANLPEFWPVNIPFYDSTGNEWLFDGNAWRQTGAKGTPSSAAAIAQTQTTLAQQQQAGFAIQAAAAEAAVAQSAQAAAVAAQSQPAPAIQASSAATPAAAPAPDLSSWLTSNSIFTGLPNWGTLAIGLGAALVAAKLMRGK